MRSKNIHAEMFKEHIEGEGIWQQGHKEPNSQRVYKARGQQPKGGV